MAGVALTTSLAGQRGRPAQHSDCPLRLLRVSRSAAVIPAMLSDTDCAAGDKCTWVFDYYNPLVGHIDCPPIGTVPIGQRCRFTQQAVWWGTGNRSVGRLAMR